MLNEVKIIEAGELVVFKSDRIASFRQLNTIEHPFGEIAKTMCQSPLTLRAYFTDGNTCKFRGDKKTGYVGIMATNLSELAKQYIRERKITEAIIYDNRPEAFKKIILYWKDGVLKENLLGLYIHNYKLIYNSHQ
jgi:hypothetical protein